MFLPPPAFKNIRRVHICWLIFMLICINFTGFSQKVPQSQLILLIIALIIINIALFFIYWKVLCIRQNRIEKQKYIHTRIKKIQNERKKQIEAEENFHG